MEMVHEKPRGVLQGPSQPTGPDINDKSSELSPAQGHREGAGLFDSRGRTLGLPRLLS